MCIRDSSKADLPKSPSSYLLQFHASWCPPCKQLTPRLIEVYNQNKSRNFDIYRIDIDKVKDLSQQYDVAAVPMLVGVVNEQTVVEEVGLSEKKEINRIFEIIEREIKKSKEKK
eukprot:TRINITY_DN8156_c0_g1_i4.p2 TRINITY_DN8156_c0_g1~~TRINITY_DN8156_c0_g1_i4.p2  ORF type:complete len:114 (+),score=16.33 TRINITY_DN8156_c0_g1_i4:142-483(+)